MGMAGHLTREENTSPVLEAYMVRWQGGLDLFALLTLWLVVLPLGTLGPGDDAVTVAIACRVAVSVVFGVDIAHRARLAPRSWQYVRQHPIALLAVPLPPLRIVFSLRLITSLFRRGHIQRFLLAAVLLLANGALIVFFSERRAPGANITTVGDAMWWAIVTVTTVGYGDVYPVTVLGRFTATGIMLVGLLTIAVITAQVSASFMDQSRRRSNDGKHAGSDGPGRPDRPGGPWDDDGLAHRSDLHDRLDRIEALLVAAVAAEDAERTTPQDDEDEAVRFADDPSERA